jgi:propanediol dehydratase small subunit
MKLDASLESNRMPEMSEHEPRYPLIEHSAETLRAASGRALDDITPEALAAGELTADDLRIRAETLRAQAEIAAGAGYPQLAANLRRAAELTVLPNDELLRAYEMMKPGRATVDEMLALAGRLEAEYGAVVTAAFVREAAEAYRDRGLAK